MTICEILDDSIEQQCEFCKTIRKLSLNQMAVGSGCNGRLNSNIISLPLCENCHTVEYLICSSKDESDHPSPGSYGHRHRLLVDVLRSRLVKSGRVVAGLDPDNDKGREPTPEEIDRWFEGRLMLRRRQEAEISTGKNDS